MIAQLPPDRMPPPHPEAIPRFQHLFRQAAGLEVEKSDLKRYEGFVDHELYGLLIRGEANAKAAGDLLIEPWALPITKGLQECIHVFEKLEAASELQPVLDRLAKLPPFDLDYSAETEAELPNVIGGLSVALARSFKIIDPDVKNPQTKHWDAATQLFDLLL